VQNVLGVHQGIPVVTSEWATVCKRTLQRVPYTEYALPALKDCSVSFTNLDKREREALKIRIEELGGTVCPDMSKSCTHLVVGNENKASMKRQCVPTLIFLLNILIMDLLPVLVMLSCDHMVQGCNRVANSSGIPHMVDGDTGETQRGSYRIVPSAELV
jgi:hypothetical protein